MRFGYEGVAGLEQELGLHVESVFDIWDDVMTRMPGEQVPAANPTRGVDGLETGTRRAPERSTPTALARLALREFLTTGKLLRAPKTLDRRYDARGGTFVSLRIRDDLDRRPARGGFWCFPDEPKGLAPRDIILAAALTACDLQRAEKSPSALLKRCRLAVTLLGPLEEVSLGALDNARYGIVVKSLERRGVMGGALPNMPGIANAWQQFRHAREANARLYAHEACTLYRHDVQKLVERDETWPSFGAAAGAVAFEADAKTVTPFVRAVRLAVLGHDSNVPPLPARVEQLYLTLYVNGELKGCVGGRDVKTLAQAVWADTRFGAADAAGDVAVSVSFITGSEPWDGLLPESVAPALCLGSDALSVEQGDRFGVLLPQIAMMHNLDRRGFVDAVIDKAGITRAPYRWTRHPTTSWLATHDGVTRLRDGLPESPPTPWRHVLPWVRDFAERSQRGAATSTSATFHSTTTRRTACTQNGRRTALG